MSGIGRSMAQSVFERGEPAVYYWREEQNGKHIRSTSDKVVTTLSSLYPLNAFHVGQLQDEIEDRLRQAEAGKLRPIKEVRRIESYPGGSIFEIKWDHLMLPHVPDKASGLVELKKVHVRLYYYQEPDNTRTPKNSLWGVGLYVHEKEIFEDPNQTRVAQNKQIKVAIDLHDQISPSRWNVRELSAPELGKSEGDENER